MSKMFLTGRSLSSSSCSSSSSSSTTTNLLTSCYTTGNNNTFLLATVAATTTVGTVVLAGCCFIIVPWTLATISVVRNCYYFNNNNTNNTNRDNNSNRDINNKLRHHATVPTNDITNDKNHDSTNGTNSKDTNHGIINNNLNNAIQSNLYVGKVYHTRYQPKYHTFSYPIFLFCLNLNYDTNTIFTNILWPLVPYIINFHPVHDHLKNKEGSNIMNSLPASTNPTIQLVYRIYQLISERTQENFCPNDTTHTVLLLTHLTYYGYCFNPVSFYYIVNNTTDTIDAIVGEVSNTPWNEMYCYVLHPNSIDSVIVHATQQQIQDDDGEENEDTKDSSIGNNIGSEIRAKSTSRSTSAPSYQVVKYTFPKKFHVSPFMEMFYNYEWVFDNQFIVSQYTTKKTKVDDVNHRTNNNTSSSLSPSTVASYNTNTATATNDDTNIGLRPTIKIINNLRTQDGTNRIQFHAKLILHPHSSSALSAFHIAYYITFYPMYCVIIQGWIHYQAFILFVLKGIEYQPHPQGSTTVLSRTISTLMTPIFIMQDWFAKKQ